MSTITFENQRTANLTLSGARTHQPAAIAKVRSILASRHRDVSKRLLVAAALATAMVLFFLFYDALDAWQIIGALRAKRVIGLVVVAVALSASTVVFQAVTRNRILSPSVMGFDAMFALVATGSVFFLTARVANLIPSSIMFLIQAGLMTALAVGMFMMMIGRGRSSVHLLVLVGIVVGTLLRSVTTMMSVIMDPNEYLAVQDRAMASFAAINTQALWMTTAVTVGVVAYMMWRSRTWDILSLGQDVAVALGVNYKREVKLALTASALLVAAATALVGPLMFFGLLIANIAVYALGSSNLRHLIPASAAIGIVVLVGGQAILEHVLNQATVLPVVIELVGGALLLVMLVRAARR
ncbi:MAG: iron chelate uptake ABC transporter family permease subunit [Actinomycetaceae bacterium]|nr:iron chelate uptake ABC transporter family permease subunit [Actinomycetaceae bacterium]